MEEEGVTTLHPHGKKGVNISKRKYDAARDAIIESFRVGRDMTFTKLVEDVRQRIGSDFQGSISWYVVSVKLDLEARGILKRVPGTKPQQISLVEQGHPQEL